MHSHNKAVYGLVGYPVSHSLSPLMHNAAFRALKLDCTYELFPLKEEELEGFFKKLHEVNSPIFGLNVTIPYKEKVIKYLDGLNPYALKTKAVNTVVIAKDRKLSGFNTDGPGFLAHITELGFNSANKKVALLGCGGAARAIISVLCLLPERPVSLKIYDIDKEKANQLVIDLGLRLNVSCVQVVNSIDDLNIAHADLLINATPIGMKDSDPCLVKEDVLHKGMLVYDLIYNPAETKLLKLAKSKGAKTSNGLGMLYYQGVLAFQHWAGTEIDQTIKDKMFKALNEGLHK